MDTTHPRSGLFRAGEVLLLVGGIVRLVSAFFMVVAAVAMTYVSGVVPRPGDAISFGFIVLFYFALALLFAISALIGFLAWRKARAGETQAPGILGIVAAMLPPVDVVFLLGGIFLLVCDEAKAAAEDPGRTPAPA